MAEEEFSVASYESHLQERKLMASRCADCDGLYLPPRPICPGCHTRNMAWTELQGEGTVLGFTSITVAATAMAARGFGRDRPYLTGLVALKEGPSVAARIETAEAKEPVEHGVSVGTPVRADFLEESIGDGKKVTLVFRPI